MRVQPFILIASSPLIPFAFSEGLAACMQRLHVGHRTSYAQHAWTPKAPFILLNYTQTATPIQTPAFSQG